MGWSDVGSLLSLETLAVPDAAGNVRTGRGVDVNSSNVVVYSGDRLVATLGVSDLIVVDTTDATLVARKDAVHDIRLVVDALRSQGAPEVTQPRTSLRPWGTWTTLLELPGYKVKEIGVKPGCRASLQRHGRRGETWIVASGRARVTRGDDTLDLGPGESIHLPAGVTHRMENASTEPLRIIEVQIGDYLGEDDVERLADDWHRESTHRRST
jgi:mannose-1-phosphate guanylyltransferase/mannose-6-phosphate isomerase